MKNLSFVFSALLLLASCKDKEEERIAVEGVSLSATASVIVDGTYQLKATISPENASDKSLTWESDKPEVADVDQEGTVTGKAAGKAVITATSKSNSDKHAKCEVTVVKEKAASIRIEPQKPEVKVGKTLEMKATVVPAEASQTVTWSSGDETKATIDATTGVVTGVGAGTTVITATANDGSGTKGEVTLKVLNESDVPNVSITAIALGIEKNEIGVPKPGTSMTLSNAPRSIADSLTEVRVYITAGEGAIIKIGTTDFSSGQKVDFTNPVTFSVTEEGKSGSKEYTLIIVPYNKHSNPYGIYSVANLHDMRNKLEAGFKILDDITMPAASAANTGIPEYASQGWLPVGDEAKPFTGSLDGGGHKITDFFTDRTALYVGLFGKVGSEASIKNLAVTGTETTAVRGSNRSSNVNQYTGMLAGYSEGTIENCSASGNVSATNSSIHVGKAAAGGLVGQAKGRISNCYTTGDVSVRSDADAEAFAGGLAGLSEDATITGCYATGKVNADATAGHTSSYAGGLAGSCEKSTLDKCFAEGDISSISASTDQEKGGAYAGGLIGRLYLSSTRVDNSYALGNVSAAAKTSNSAAFAAAGGLLGFGDAGCSVSNSYAVGNISCSNAKEKFSGGLTGATKTTFTNTNCYRNSDASVKWNNNTVESADKNYPGLTDKPLADMKKEAFKGLLNGSSGTVWGHSAGENSDLPYLIGVGDEK